MRIAWPIMTLLTVPQVLFAQAREPLSVNEVISRQAELHGRTIDVRGWLGECFGYTCNLYSDRASAVAQNHDEPHLGVSPAQGFDRRARNLWHSEIILRAHFDRTCLEPVCTDRPSVLGPARILRVLTRSGHGIGRPMER
jgi:hypothetical protein